MAKSKGRKPISKKTRFEVFKRDGFQCAYCGKSPPEVLLEIDHIKPVSKGGDSGINNLITACFDCNRGKRDIPLDKAPSRLCLNLDILKQKEEQLSEYDKLVRKIKNREKRQIKKIEDLFTCYFPEKCFGDSFKNISMPRFIKKLSLDEIATALDVACCRKKDPETALKYFCGICWNKIKGESNG